MPYKPTLAQRKLRPVLMSPAKHILVYGGARSGKTFEIVNTIVLMAMVAGGRHAIFRQYFNAVRTSIFMDTIPQVLRTCYPGVPVRYHRGDSYYLVPHTGGEIWALGLDDDQRVDKILGKEFTSLYFNECSEISFHAIETAITRCSQKTRGIPHNKIFYDCNPPTRTHWSYLQFIRHIHPVTKMPLENPENYLTFKMNPEDNVENLPEDFIKELRSLSPEKQKRFLFGEFQDDNPDALWRQSVIDNSRVPAVPEEWNARTFADAMDKIVVGVDPAVTGNEKSDNTGIVVAGTRFDDYSGTWHYYILGDHSMKGHPSEWAQEVAKCFSQYHANEVVVETNQGGEMVIETLRNANYNLPIRSVRATNNKMVRAEPVATLYQNGLVHHTRVFSELEDELTSYSGKLGEKSPDRMDALVWAMTELSEHKTVSGGDVWFG